MSPVSEQDDRELFEPLFTEGDLLDQEAAEAIVQGGERRVPRLREILSDGALWDDEGPRGWAPVHAAFLLAAIRPPGVLEDLVGALERGLKHSVTALLDAASSLLAYGADPDPEGLRKILLNRSRSDFLRAEAGAALLAMAGSHPEHLEPALGLLRSVASDPSENRTLRLSVGLELLELGHPQDRDLLLSFGPNDLFDPDYVNEVMDEGEPNPPWPPEPPLAFYDPEAIQRRLEEEEELQGPARLEEEPHDHSLDDLDPDLIVPPDVAGELLGSSAPDPELSSHDPDGSGEIPPPPFRREESKIGRNDPCRCGSGKKWKKCCGR